MDAIDSLFTLAHDAAVLAYDEPAPTPPLALPPREYPALRAWRRLRPNDWRTTCHRDPLWHAAVLERQAQEWDALARQLARSSRHSAEAARRQADHYVNEAADVLATMPEPTHVAA